MILREKSFMDALGELSAIDLHDAVSKGIKTVQAEAKSLCPVYDGELRDSIYTSVENGEESIRGTCYTNKSYAAYVEFGTGPKGQANHEGISPDAVSYTHLETRMVFKMYYTEGLGFEAISIKLGRIRNGDYIRLRIRDKFLKENNIN